jgi:hypothetical protein
VFIHRTPVIENLSIMIKVLRHGDTISVRNPITGTDNVMVNVTFVEEGRNGGDATMSETSAFLAAITGGDEVGLQNLRIHTHPVLEEQLGKFPIGQELPGHINRGMFSTPQLKQQEGVPPRMINGRPTYFKTWIGPNPEEDVDYRISNDVMAASSPNSVFGAQIGAAQVRVVSIDSRKGIQPNRTGQGQERIDETKKTSPEPVVARTGS